MYKPALYKVCRGTFCLAVGQTETNVYTREDGRIVRRKLQGGKLFGARACSYADAYFAYPCGTAEIIGEEVFYDATRTDS